ncbi:MAG: TspO/MBR family protein [Mucilaginibacter sp.]
MINQNKDIEWEAFIILLAINVAIGVVTSFFTSPEIHNWYAFLQKPSFTPPSWVFAPVWSIIYVLIAYAAYRVWRHRNDGAEFTGATLLYITQLVLNFVWPIVFFGMHQLFWALVVILALLVSIILTMVWFSRFSRTGAWLLLPYALWVSFASLLNLNIYLLNR